MSDRDHSSDAGVFDRVAALTGRRLRLAAGIAGAEPHPSDRVVGRVVWLAIPVAVIDLRVVPVVAAAVVALQFLSRRRDRHTADRALMQELPPVVDLLSVAVAGGLTIPMAVQAVGDRLDGRFAAALGDCHELALRGQRLADALERLSDRFGDPVRPLIRVLVSAERYGTPLADALQQVAVDVRTARRRHAETTARRLPVLLLFPLVVCVLPAFVLLTVVPVLVSSLAALR